MDRVVRSIEKLCHSLQTTLQVVRSSQIPSLSPCNAYPDRREHRRLSHHGVGQAIALSESLLFGGEESPGFTGHGGG